MKNILLLGGNGYIGSRLQSSFREDFNLEVVDLNWFSKNFVEGFDYSKLSEEKIQKHDVVILLAGHSSVKMCQDNRLSSFNNNVKNFITLLDKINLNQKFIYASSSSVYGNTNNKIVNESYDQFIPNNYYDLTKQIIDFYAIQSKLNYYGLRFGTVNGWSENLRNDVMINAMVDSAMRDGHIKLYIKNINRPILGINDLSRCIRALIDSDKSHPGIYNLASFNSTAIEIANIVSRVSDKPVIEYQPDKIEKITNEKLQSNAYDFAIDCSKFTSTYNFEFRDTIESITKELIEGYNSCNKSSRGEGKEYE